MGKLKSCTFLSYWIHIVSARLSLLWGGGQVDSTFNKVPHLLYPTAAVWCSGCPTISTPSRRSQLQQQIQTYWCPKNISGKWIHAIYNDMTTMLEIEGFLTTNSVPETIFISCFFSEKHKSFYKMFWNA